MLKLATLREEEAMSKRILRWAIVCLFMSSGVAVPARAALVEVAGQGWIPGTVTTYTCPDDSALPPFCPYTTVKDRWHYSIDEIVDTEALASGPASFNEQTGPFFWEMFDIALVGTDRWGNYAFEGQNLSAGGIEDPHGCIGPDYPCQLTYYNYAAATFPLHQIVPAPVPEPGTWMLMLLGFGAVAEVLRRNSRQNLLPGHT